jgi:FKBP-type peptidyl-prolyl cis-trans isomerase
MKKLTRNEWVGVVMALLVIGLFFGVGMYYKTDNQQPMENTSINNIQGLQITDVLVGTGAEASVGDTAVVHYVGMFADGRKFDSSIDRGTPFSFVLGKGMVIKGWDEGVVGMKAGGKRKLVVSPEMGYGMSDYGPIPGGSTLYFDVELLGVQKPQ